MKKRLLSCIITMILIIVNILPNLAFATSDDFNECYLCVLDESRASIRTFFQYNGKFWPSMSSINVKSGDIFTIYASPTTKVVCLYYAWDNDDEIFTIEKVASNLRVPLDFEIGSTHWLRMSALFVNGESSEPEFFEFVIEENSNIPADEELNKKIHALNRIIEVPIDATLPINSYISIAPRYPVSVSPFYYWDDNEVIELKNTSVALPIEIPEDFEVDSEHTLTLYSVGEDGTSTIPKTYTIQFTEAVDEFATPISEGNQDLR